MIHFTGKRNQGEYFWILGLLQGEITYRCFSKTANKINVTEKKQVLQPIMTLTHAQRCKQNPCSYTANNHKSHVYLCSQLCQAIHLGLMTYTVGKITHHII